MTHNNKKGQNAIEYMLLLALVIIIILVALSPTGFLSQGIDDSLNIATDSINIILTNTWNLP